MGRLVDARPRCSGVAPRCLLWSALAFAWLAAGIASAGEFRSRRGFALTYPEGWSVATKEPQKGADSRSRLDIPGGLNVDLDRIAVFIYNPMATRGPESVNVFVHQAPTAITEASCAAQRREVIQKVREKGGMAVNVESCLIKIRDRDAISGHWDIRSGGSATLIRQWQVVLSSRRRTFWLTCSAPAAAFARLDPVFTEIVNSVTIAPDRGWDGLPPVAQYAILGAVVGALVGGIAVLYKLARRKPSAG